MFHGSSRSLLISAILLAFVGGVAFAGYGDERYLIPNNRLRRASLTIYILITGETERAVVFSVEQLLHKELRFDDTCVAEVRGR